MSCIFCEEMSITERQLFSTERFVARWDMRPSTPGHVLVVPRRHVQFVEDLQPNEVSEIMSVTQKAIEKICKTDLVEVYEQFAETIDDFEKAFFIAGLERLNAHHGAPDGFTIGINDGPAAGQTIPHLHVHVMPRWTGDVDHPRGGVRQVMGVDEYAKGMRQ